MTYCKYITKRPVTWMACMLLAGTLAGLRETPALLKAAVWAAVWAAAWAAVFPGGAANTADPLAAALSLVPFLVGFLRASCISSLYHNEVSEAFFAAYRPTNPGQFDYAMYLKGQGIHTAAQYAAYKNAAGAGAEALRDTGPLPLLLARLRDVFEQVLDADAAPGDAALWKAIMLGQKDSLEPEVRGLYQAAGISHLLAVSGLHVSLLGMGAYSALGHLPLTRGRAAGISAVLVFLYMIMTGGSGSVVRASVMLFFAFGAIGTGRHYSMRNALAAALMLILLLRPYQVFQAGFQLSFGAVAAIVFVSGPVTAAVEKRRERTSRGRDCRGESCRRGTHRGANCRGEDHGGGRYVTQKSRLPGVLKVLAVSISIQLVTLPVIAWHYFVFPPYGILLNLLVIPLLTAVIASGAAVLGLGLLMGALRLPSPHIPALLAGAPGHWVLRLYEFLCRKTLEMPFGSVCVGRPEISQILVYYGLLVLGVLTFVRKQSKDKEEPETPEARAWRMSSETRTSGGWPRRLPCLLLSAACISLVLRPLPRSGLEITAVDVGQGDGFLITCGKRAFLIDGGSSSNEKLGENILRPLLLARGITQLDACIVSHGDRDHVSGLEYLLSENDTFKIQRMILPAPARESDKYDRLRELADSSGTEVHYLEEGEELCPGEEARAGKELKLSCIFPGREDGEDTNRHSSVLLLKYRTFTMLFTGDLEGGDEAAVQENYLNYTRAGNGGSVASAFPGVTVLKVAHHGSAGSTTEEFLQTVKPGYALISVGRKNVYGHPAPAALERLEAAGAEILRTSERGAVLLRVRDNRLYIEGFSDL